MKWNAILMVIAAGVLPPGSTFGDEHKFLKAFPPAESPMQRFVIELPHKDRAEEDRFKVELMVGKEVTTDGVNRSRLGGTIESKPLKGWGFTFYEVTKFGPTASTLMAVPPGTKPKTEFLFTSKLISYNSRIPVVVYVPSDGEVRYRIWEASKEVKKADNQ